jgi:glutamyl-tRNA synthetase
MSQPIVRFAPSPTGYLHVGGARTALINYIYAKQNNGKFLLRIEDTDNQRNTKECIDAIFDSLKWLNISYDGEAVIQSKNINRHVEVAKDLLQKDRAYQCFCTQEELDAHREYCTKNSIPPTYSKKCRNLSEEQRTRSLENNKNPVIRLKVPEEDKYITVNDMIKGKVSVNYNQLDDFILLRSDETPIYMLSVVVDDHDMNITHIIRGDDHFTNTFRQIMLYKLNDWNVPQFGHLPLIYGNDGKKLSKRFNAVGTDDYKNMGYLPDGLKIYLATMGTSINVTGSFDELIKSFKINKLSKSPTQFDINFLGLINQKIMKSSNPKDIIQYMIPFVETKLNHKLLIDDISVIERAYSDVVSRSKSLIECADLLEMYYKPDLYDSTIINREIYDKLKSYISKINFESSKTIKEDLLKFAEENQYQINDITNILRIIITGKEQCPSTYNIMYAISKENTINRFNL